MWTLYACRESQIASWGEREREKERERERERERVGWVSGGESEKGSGSQEIHTITTVQSTLNWSMVTTSEKNGRMSSIFRTPTQSLRNCIALSTGCGMVKENEEDMLRRESLFRMS